MLLSDLHNALPFLVKGVDGQDSIDTVAFGRFIGDLGQSKRHTNLLKTLNRVKVGVITGIFTFGPSPGGMMTAKVMVINCACPPVPSESPVCHKPRREAGCLVGCGRNRAMSRYLCIVLPAVLQSGSSEWPSAKAPPRLIRRYSDITIGQHEVVLDVRGNVSVGANTVDGEPQYIGSLFVSSAGWFADDRCHPLKH